jgi:hypothetical protein
LSGLENINHPGITNLIIEYNPALSLCEVESICDYLSIPYNTTSTSNNTAGCLDRSEIEDACTTSMPTCLDNVQNGDETFVDCGGSLCPPCDSSFITTW